MLRSKPSPTQRQLHRVKDQVFSTLRSKCSTFSLFDKLQIYDQAITEEGVSRVDPEILRIFEQIIEEHGGSDSHSERFQAFSSPPSHKRQQVEDPELFSFSKTRKEEAVHVDGFISMGKTRLPNKKQNLTDQPKAQKYRATNSEISQFISEEPNSTKNPIHVSSKQLKQLILTNNFKKFVSLGSKSLEKRRQNLRIMSSEYIHQLTLIKKSMKGLIDYTTWQKSIIQEKKEERQFCLLGSFFKQWRQYAQRSEEEKSKEIQIKEKRKLFTKKLAFSKFVLNSNVFMEECSGRLNYEKYVSQVRKNLFDKSESLKKIIYLRRLEKKWAIKNQNKQKFMDLQRNLRQSESQVFHKLLECHHMKAQSREDCLVDLIRKNVFGLTFISRLKEQYHFQKAYWKTSVSPFGTQNIYGPNLNEKYKKIVLIYELFDTAEHSLNRKGYMDNEGSFSITQQMKSHPAYSQFYQPYKLRKYFSCFKKYFKELKQKQEQVKYSIIGKRTYENILLWYRDSIQNRVNDVKISEKFEELSSVRIFQKQRDFLSEFQKMTDFKQGELEKKIEVQRKQRGLQILKAYRISKKYYIKKLKQNNERKISRIRESCFLEWKLFHIGEIHRRFMVKQCLQVRKKYALRSLTEQVSENGLADKVFSKKLKNLFHSLVANKGDVFIEKLKDNAYRQKGSNSSKIVRKKTEAMKSKILILGKKNVLSKLVKNKKFMLLNKNINQGLKDAYQKRLKFKVMRALIACKKVQKSEKEKTKIITNLKDRKTKERIFQIMAGRMLQSLILKRTTEILRKQVLALGLFWLRNNEDQHQSHSLLEDSFEK